MNLNSKGREFYALQIVTTPPVTAWDVSFDQGTTWLPGTTTDGITRWLVAGPDAPVGAAVAVITGTTSPLVRATDNPELLVEQAPRIRLT